MARRIVDNTPQPWWPPSSYSRHGAPLLAMRHLTISQHAMQQVDVVKAVDPIKIDPTSFSNTCKLFDNLHMQLMCIWMCPYHITAAFVDKIFGVT